MFSKYILLSFLQQKVTQITFLEFLSLKKLLLATSNGLAVTGNIYVLTKINTFLPGQDHVN